MSLARVKNNNQQNVVNSLSLSVKPLSLSLSVVVAALQLWLAKHITFLPSLDAGPGLLGERER
jgi:hypothetical protein